MTKNEQEAVIQYVEFLLVSHLVDPIIEKHIKDQDVRGACYAALYEILDDLDTTIDIYGSRSDVDLDTNNI